MAEKPNILIAVPAYRGLVHAGTMVSVISAIKSIEADGGGADLRTIDKADISLVRNFFAAVLLRDATFSHILFSDDDMRFRGQAIVRLLRAGKKFVGLASPFREMNGGFNVKLHQGKTQAVNGLLPVYAIGMGVTLIHRSVFEEMLSRGLVHAHKNNDHQIDGKPITLHSFFSVIETPERRLSEDLSFCARWREGCNGDIFALVDETIGHIGLHEFSGRMVDHGLRVPETINVTEEKS